MRRKDANPTEKAFTYGVTGRNTNLTKQEDERLNQRKYRIAVILVFPLYFYH